MRDDPNAPPPPDDTRFGALANKRGAFVKELDSNPDLRRTLMQSVYREVGSQSPRMQQAYLEGVMNRAVSRKQSLYQAITDKGYYPPATLDQLGPDKPAAPDTFQTNLSPTIQSVLGGSNIAKFGTGNQGIDPKTGKRVLSGGATITVPHETDEGDDIIIEKPDAKWAAEKQQEQAYVAAHGQPITPDVGPVNALKVVPAKPFVPHAQPVGVPHAQPAHPIAQTDTDDTSDPAYQWPET